MILSYLLFSLICWFPCISLPWQGLKANTKKQKYDKISEKKMLTPVEVLLSVVETFSAVTFILAPEKVFLMKFGVNNLKYLTMKILQSGAVQILPIRVYLLLPLLPIFAV